jgi:hypothetical protein
VVDIDVPCHTPEDIVPTDVKLDPVTVALSDVPVNVEALAVTVPDPPSEIEVPFTVTAEFTKDEFEFDEPSECEGWLAGARWMDDRLLAELNSAVVKLGQPKAGIDRPDSMTSRF